MAGMNIASPARDGAATGDIHPYASLTPDVVLDALASVGLYGDGRLALSSSGAVCYQIHLEEPHAGHAVVVADFYSRFGRWSAAQILEEHSFSTDGSRNSGDRPARAARQARCMTSAASPSASALGVADTPPSLDDFEVLWWMGRLGAHPHRWARGALHFIARRLARRAGLCHRAPATGCSRMTWTFRWTFKALG